MNIKLKDLTEKTENNWLINPFAVTHAKSQRASMGFITKRDGE
jgi:hypothetical protein